MEMDEEGFRYPKVDLDVCINCHKCEKACPELKPEMDDSKPLANYVIQQKDKGILRNSTSGGFYSAVAEYVIKQGGVVFGASFDKDMVLRHTHAETLEDCKQFRGSKYVQSEIQHTFTEMLQYLKEGRLVVFSGTPCQIAGLYGFLGNRKYENLVTVDLVCHGTPSPLLLKKYLAHQAEVNHDKVVDYRSRDKYYGYDYSTATIYFEDNKHQYHKGMESDLMLRLYFKNLISRPSCYSCHFKTLNRVSDITIFDCWDAPSVSKKFSGDGATNVFIHTEKGAKVFGAIKDHFIWAPSDLDSVIKRDGIMIKHHVTPNPKRSDFFKDLQTMTIPQIEEKYDHKSALRKMIGGVKPILHSLGVFSLYMRLKTKRQ
jgi:coenzyme F420-reducing hydrogenase beta subunit